MGTDKRRKSKLRLAIGLFSGPADACAAARALHQAGVAPSLVSLAASPEVVAGSAECRGALGSGAVTQDLAGLPAVVSCSADKPGCCGTFLPVGPVSGEGSTAQMGAIAAALSEHLRSRPMRQQERRLREHLAARRWLLVVLLADAAQEHEVCTTLLRRARFGMQTHEIRRA